ncbi:hypothetical protein I3843_Q058900 [Carya illinoinensis]|nr:hypothetical protein I3843_Q058900 [Carya illinoinensis]
MLPLNLPNFCGLSSVIFYKGSLCKKWWMKPLRHVPNNDGDKNIEMVNQIRDSLAIMGDNSTTFSLPQACDLYCHGCSESTKL